MKNMKDYPLWSAEGSSKIHNKDIKSLSQREINDILRLTGYDATLHFVERVSQKDGRKRWYSFGITTGGDFINALRGARRGNRYTDAQGRTCQDLSIEAGMIKIVTNPETRKLVTITYA